MRVRSYIEKAAQYALCLNILFIFSVTAYAEVILDGTLGAKGSITGPNYNITSTMGQTYGGNLFHSFSAFNLNNTESAIFTGPSTVTNIISRVTGGQASSIDGTIKSSIAGADFWFINPSGIVFGQNAKLDVGGSFHASTADYIKLSDNSRFDASKPATPILTSASPSAFGFLSSNPTGISLKDGALLKVSEGKTLSMVGGNLDIQNSNLYASAGTINLVAVASAGEAVVNKQNFNIDSFNKLGNINIKETRARSESPAYDFESAWKMANVDTSGICGGNIFIRGGKFFSDGGRVYADSHGNNNGTGIDILTTDSVNISGKQSGIESEAIGEGNGGNISIVTAQLNISDGAFIAASAEKGSNGNAGDITIKVSDSVNMSGSNTRIQSNTLGKGNGGNINIDTTTLKISTGAYIASAVVQGSKGDAGNINIKAADSVEISGYSSKITSDTWDKGKAGNINIATAKLNISGSAYISASADKGSEGNGGSINIKATDYVEISGHYYDGGNIFLGSSIKSETWGRGNAGSISIDTSKLNISDVANISTNTREGSSGDGGNIIIKAADYINISGHYSNYGSTIKSETSGTGKAGNIIIGTSKLNISDVASISTSARPGSSGDGGNIAITATDSINISGHGRIESMALGNGNAGDIHINTSATIQLVDSSVTTAADSSGGGQIYITAGRMINLINSETTATVAGGTSNGGNINATAPFFILNNSKVTAQADEGKGGNINLKTDTYIRSLDSEVSSSSRLGIDGTVVTSSPAIDISGKVALVQIAYTDTALLAPKQCVEREDELSSFAVKGRDGLPPFPDSLLAIP